MSGRKRSREGQLAGCSPEERVTSWFTHFRDLLGTHPTVDGAEEEIPAVLTNLEIDDGPFTATEFATVKSTLKEGKSAGPDDKLLAEEGEPTTYERFLSTSEEATRKWVPTKGRHRASPRSKHPEVVRARTRVEEARRSFEREGTAESQEELNGAKQQLFSTYDRIKGEELMEKVKKVATVHGERRYKESWKVINEMSGRKRSREGQLAGCSPEERVTSWFTHFRDLLGTHPTVDGAEEEIPAVLTNLEIDDGPFTATEFATVKSTLKEGKSAGPDGIPQEVPKNCDLDDIILEICNQALMENIKPDI
ncbi:hypothetical protein AAFF_G00197540 [Aldrovandia affinis]|uniref:Uncharacterized protein n=1 Tax=Aldrovandia affinis TaxID=143900 RepID=A0AAD7RIG7_9TELE|nr:hypothetical protein AAFF_G00197540 [Aldrovandia affinis]